jgi:hypothetical protein
MLESNRPYNEIDGGVDGGRGVGFWMGASIGSTVAAVGLTGAQFSVMRKDMEIRSILPNQAQPSPLNQTWRDRTLNLFRGHNPNPADVEQVWDARAATDPKTARLNKYRKMGAGKKALIAGAVIAGTSILGGMLDNPNS